MSNLATLKPFKKGKDPRRNIEGKKKGTVSLITKLREALDHIHDGTQKPYHELLVASILKDGIKTDGQSRRLLLQYLEGMPKETKDINVTLPQPIMDITNGIQSNNSNKKDNNSK